MTAIDNLIESFQKDLERTNTPEMKILLGPAFFELRIKIYHEMITRAEYHKRRNK